MPAKIVRNLMAGLAALVSPRAARIRFRAGVFQACIGLALCLLLIGLFDYIASTGDIYFDYSGAALLGSIIGMGLLTAIAVCAIEAEFPRLPLLLTAACFSLAWYLLVILGVQYLFAANSTGVLLWVSALCWGLAIMLRALKLAFGKPRLRSYLLVACVLVAGVGVLQMALYSPGLFFAYDAASYAEYDAIDQEGTYYRQSVLLGNKLALLTPQRPGVEDVYFLGFAGSGDEGVFYSEAHFAAATAARLYATEGRSLVLASKLDNLETEPLANIYNLDTTLQVLGELMDTQDDVLFLFLTSHGSAESAVQVSLYPFAQKAVTAQGLRASLDAAGIRWRIIVISACYSGSFIETLADEHTLILTAAAADKTSFGCSNDRELTYFGEAFLRDALASEHDLVRAFAVAQERIAEREEAEDLTPSEPQISVGEAIVDKLDAMAVFAN